MFLESTPQEPHPGAPPTEKPATVISFLLYPDPLRSLRRRGKPAGRGEFVQTVVDDRYRGISIRADLLLPEGTIELQGAGLSIRPPGGAKPSRETAMAIVGGTGAYAGAGGSADLSAAGHLKQRIELNFSN